MFACRLLRWCAVWLLALTVASSWTIGRAAADEEDFCLRTRIFDATSKQPIGENLTIFQGNKIYDFQLLGPPTVSVFDVESRRFLLARPDKEVQTTVSADELVRFAAQEHPQALQSRNELVRFAAEPKFREQYSRESGVLELFSPLLEYRIETVSEDPTVVHRYVQFANWYAYLNSMFNPMPPTVRLELNQSLDRHACLPKVVERRLKQNGVVVQTLTMTSRHELLQQLDDAAQQAMSNWQAQQPHLHYTDLASFRALQQDAKGVERGNVKSK